MYTTTNGQIARPIAFLKAMGDAYCYDVQEIDLYWLECF